MAIGRIGPADRVNRDNSSSSAGLDQQDKLAKADAKPARNEKVDQVAKMYEKEFLREMVKAMRGTVDFGNDKPGMGESIYRNELDEQYTESWGDNGGIGLANLIYDQVMDRYFNSEAGAKIKGGDKSIPLTDRDVSKVIRVKTAEDASQIPLRIELKKSADGSPAKVRAPWAGEVVSNTRLEGGKTALQMKHGPGLRSTLVFQGVVAADAKIGAKLEKGDAVGTLSPEIHSFLWNINKSAPDPDASRGQAAGAPPVEPAPGTTQGTSL